MTATLSSTFFGPVQWYQKLLRYDRVFIEQCDSYQKQTYRNRCLIATTGGVQALTVPVSVERREESGECRVDSVECRVDSVEFATALPSSGTGNPVGNSTLSTLHSKLSNGNPVANSTLIKISDHGNWRHQHWQALQSAYGDSPFFEFYEDDLRPFFTERWELLYDYNEAIRKKMCELLDIQPVVELTTQYLTQPENDLREAIRPKHPAPDPDFAARRYYQVYQQKHGFLPNLSILDLLFNMGPESIFYLV